MNFEDWHSLWSCLCRRRCWLLFRHHVWLVQYLHSIWSIWRSHKWTEEAEVPYDVSANAAISLMGFDPFWTSENFHATCDTCLEWKKLVNEREEERESQSHVSHLACLVPKSHFPLTNCWLHYLPKDSLSMACELSLLWELPLWWHEEGPLKMEERLHSFSLDSEWFCCFSFTFTLFTWRKGIDNWFLKNQMLKFCTHLWNHPTSCKNQESSPGTVIDHLNEFVGSGIYKPDITALHLECMCIMLVLWEKAHEIVYVLWE